MCHLATPAAAQHAPAERLPETPMAQWGRSEQSNGWQLSRKGETCMLSSWNSPISIHVDPHWTPTARIRVSMIDHPFEGVDGSVVPLNVMLRPAGGGQALSATVGATVVADLQTYAIPLDAKEIAQLFPAGFDLALLDASGEPYMSGSTGGSQGHLAALVACATGK